MARSSCPKCGGHSFEITEASISDAAYSYNFIQCSKLGCGAVVGVVDYFHTATRIDEVKKVVEANSSSSGLPSQFINVMQHNMQSLFNNIQALSKQINDVAELVKTDKRE